MLYCLLMMSIRSKAYDKFWDIVRTERTYYNSARRHGYEDGKVTGLTESELDKILSD